MKLTKEAYGRARDFVLQNARPLDQALFSYLLETSAPDRVIDAALALAMIWARIELGAARLICGIRLTISGLEHLPPLGPALIASRHESAFDTMVWRTVRPRASYVLKRELTRSPVFVSSNVQSSTSRLVTVVTL